MSSRDFVNAWLWEAKDRATNGMPWSHEYRHDAALMVAAAEKRGAEARDREWLAALALPDSPGRKAILDAAREGCRAAVLNERSRIAAKVRGMLADHNQGTDERCPNCASLRWVLGLLGEGTK